MATFKKTPTYCQYCGKKLQEIQEGFDIFSGKKRVTAFRCPDWEPLSIDLNSIANMAIGILESRHSNFEINYKII